MTNFKLCSLGVLVLFYFQINAQEVFTPGECAQDLPAHLSTQLQEKQQSDLDLYKGEYIEELEAVYQERYYELSEQFERKLFLTDKKYQTYLDNILNKILQANPHLADHNLHLLLSRSGIPNAYCRGDGVLVLNLGLVQRLENEAQLAFIICHEIAHQTGNHVNKKIEQRIDFLYDKKTQKELKRIRKQTYNRSEAALDLLEGHAYSSNRHSRNREGEADSIALVLLSQTDYSLEDAITVMEILDVIDLPDTLDLGLARIFNFAEFPFQEKWIAPNQTRISRLAPAKTNTFRWYNIDSLKTHPACQDRHDALHRQLVNTSRVNQAKPSSPTFHDFQTILFREQIEAAIDIRRYDLVIFYSLQAIDQFPNDPYSIINIGRALNNIYELRKSHELGKYLPMPSSRNGKAHGNIIRMIHSLRLSEANAMAFYFFETHASQFEEQEDFLFERYRSCENFEQTERAASLEKKYKALYPTGKYLDRF